MSMKAKKKKKEEKEKKKKEKRKPQQQREEKEREKGRRGREGHQHRLLPLLMNERNFVVRRISKNEKKMKTCEQNIKQIQLSMRIWLVIVKWWTSSIFAHVDISLKPLWSQIEIDKGCLMRHSTERCELNAIIVQRLIEVRLVVWSVAQNQLIFILFAVVWVRTINSYVDLWNAWLMRIDRWRRRRRKEQQQQKGAGVNVCFFLSLLITSRYECGDNTICQIDDLLLSHWKWEEARENHSQANMTCKCFVSNLILETVAMFVWAEDERQRRSGSALIRWLMRKWWQTGDED